MINTFKNAILILFIVSVLSLISGCTLFGVDEFLYGSIGKEIFALMLILFAIDITVDLVSDSYRGIKK